MILNKTEFLKLIKADTHNIYGALNESLGYFIITGKPDIYKKYSNVEIYKSESEKSFIIQIRK